MNRCKLAIVGAVLVAALGVTLQVTCQDAPAAEPTAQLGSLTPLRGLDVAVRGLGEAEFTDKTKCTALEAVRGANVPLKINGQIKVLQGGVVAGCKPVHTVKGVQVTITGKARAELAATPPKPDSVEIAARKASNTRLKKAMGNLLDRAANVPSPASGQPKGRPGSTRAGAPFVS